MTPEAKVGGGISKDDLRVSGGNNLTRMLIFGRPELFEQCPPELQDALILLHKAETLRTMSRYEESRVFFERAYGALLPQSDI